MLKFQSLVTALWFAVFMTLALGCADPKYAKYNQHTMCLPPKSCAGKKLISTSTLDHWERKAILDVHNKLRHLVATGRIAGQPPAKNMQQLTWDEELALVAQRWAEQCKFQHDPQRRVDRFRVGQNLAYEWNFPPSQDKSALMMNTTIQMFNEVHKPGFSSSNIHPFKFKSGAGHYTQMAWATTILMGCGFVMYEEGKNTKNNGWRVGETKYIACNFGPAGNVMESTMYEVGSPSCEVFSNQYSGLCTTKEVNKNFITPCDDNNFEKRYPFLCNEEEFEKLLLSHGVEYSSGLSGWTILIIVLVIFASLCLAGYVVVKLNQDGRLTRPMQEFNFPKVKFRGPWKS